VIHLDEGPQSATIEDDDAQSSPVFTGNVGQHSLRTIIGRPDLELVGVHAASPNKIG
jgi:hypothetical protein